jgi:hypothetical protein
MRKIVFIIISILAGSMLSFTNFYPDGVASEAHSVVENDDSSGVVLCGCGPGFAMEINFDGNTQWLKKYYYSMGGLGLFDINNNSDNTYTFCGSVVDTTVVDDRDIDIYAGKIDSDGNLLWENTYGGINRDDVGFSVIETPDKGFLIVGDQDSDASDPYHYNNMVVLRIDSLGERLWMETFHWDTASFAFDAVLLPDTTYLVTGSIHYFDSTCSKLMRMNDDGDTLWCKDFPIFNFDELDLFEDKLLCSGSADGLGMLDTSGSFIWVNDSIVTARAIFLDEETIVALVARSIIYLNHDGEILSSHALDLSFYVNDFIPTSDGGFALVGEDFGDHGIFVSKVDSLGRSDNSYPIDLKRGWNMISYPYDRPTTARDVFPSLEGRYIYEFINERGVYDVCRYSIEPGKGMFALSETDTTLIIDGARRVCSMEIDIYRGWNMIGSPADKFSTADLLAEYPEIIGPVYYFNTDSAAYFPADTMRPCRSYWMLSTEDSVSVMFSR